MSSEPFDFHAGGQLGDYRLRRVIREGVHSVSWEAEQISMEREVVVEALKPDRVGDAALVATFLADVRAKAAVDHPNIGSVYEAVENGEAVYFAREALGGESLQELVSAKRRFPPVRVLRMLEQTGEALTYLEEKEVATAALEPGQMILGPHDAVRLSNLAIAGEPAAETAWADRELIAGHLRKLLRPGEPGSTRTGRLLDFLPERGEEAVTWAQVVHTAAKLRRELGEGSRTVAIAGAQRRKFAGAWLGVVGVMVLLALIGGGLWLLVRNGKPAPAPARAPVLIPAGSYPGPGGGEVVTGTFWIDAREVTIADYAHFLEALDLVAEASRKVYDHRDQPEGKEDHRPGDWEALLAAAEAEGEWNGLTVTMDCPVVNVDWWDAYAYANWRGGRLPTSKEWAAARRGALPAWSGWGPAEGSTEDLAAGVHGLAGNVSEWTRDPELNPAFPMDPRRPLICGASYLRVQGGFEARWWVDSPSLRRPDLGFRVVYEEAPGL